MAFRGFSGQHNSRSQYHESEANFYTFSYLAVRPEARRKGYATAMFRHIRMLAVQSGQGKILVAIRRSLSENVEFIKSLEFLLIGPFEASDAHDVYELEIGKDL